MSAGRRFPVLSASRREVPEAPSDVPWALLAPYEENADHAHGQSLERLAARGGLGVSEMVAIIDGVGLRGMLRPDREMLPRLLELIAQHEQRGEP